MAATAQQNRVSFHFITPTPELKDRLKLKSFIPSIFKEHQKLLSELTIVFCDDEFLLRINQEFLQHDYYTDILSFDLSERGLPLTGEIYISVSRTRENAAIHQIAPQIELRRVIFHGILHFCGFKDNTQARKKDMTKQEDKLLRRYLRFVSRETRST